LDGEQGVQIIGGHSMAEFDKNKPVTLEELIIVRRGLITLGRVAILTREHRSKTLLAEMVGEKIRAAGQVELRDLRGFLAKDIEEHIRTLAANCRGDGFGTWGTV
jgi:hypothetical protein